MNMIKRLWSRIHMSASIQTHEIFSNFVVHILERLEHFLSVHEKKKPFKYNLCDVGFTENAGFYHYYL